jgi:hypothetical protein
MTRTALLSLALLLVGGLAAAAQAGEKFQLIDIPQLEFLKNDARTPVTILDANEPDVREKNGVIPGAKLLSSFNHYDIQKELPADKNAPLVFYCTNRL